MICFGSGVTYLRIMPNNLKQYICKKEYFYVRLISNMPARFICCFFVFFCFGYELCP